MTALLAMWCYVIGWLEDAIGWDHFMARHSWRNTAGHLGIGLIAASIFVLFGLSEDTVMAAAAALGVGREWGQSRDAEWHLADRTRDVLEIIIGSWLACAVWF